MSQEVKYINPQMKPVKAWAIVRRFKPKVMALCLRRPYMTEYERSHNDIVRVEIREVKKRKAKFVEGCEDCEREQIETLTPKKRKAK